MRVGLPVRVAVHAVHPASVAVLEGFPGVAYEDETVSFTAASFEEANLDLALGAVIGVGSMNDYRLFPELVQGDSGQDELRTAFLNGISERWLDVDSGRWPPPQPEP